jgi:hypothetical protein
LLVVDSLFLAAAAARRKEVRKVGRIRSLLATAS